MEPDGFWKKKKKRIQVQTGASEATRHRKRHQGKSQQSSQQTTKLSVRIHVPFFYFYFFFRLQGKVTRQRTTNKSSGESIPKRKKEQKKIFFSSFLELSSVFLLTIVLSGAQFKSKKRKWSICHRCRQ